MKIEMTKAEMREKIEMAMLEHLRAGKAVPLYEGRRNGKTRSARHRPNKQVGKL